MTGKKNSDVFSVSTDFMDKYYEKRIEVHHQDGRIIRGKVRWYGEGEEETELCLDDIEVDGKKLDYGIFIPESNIQSFIPLEGENTESIF